MAHFSRLSRIVVDVPEQLYEGEIRFWREALAIPLSANEHFPEFSGADLTTDGFGLLVQRIGEDRPRIHLDIHTTDRPAEVARLTGLGATIVEERQHWTIMRDPAGLHFCVVPDSRLNESNAHLWP